MNVDQHTTLYGVVGTPIVHSLSPVMHNAAFSATGLNSIYLAFDTEDIAGCLKGVRAFCIRGLSVTIPFKAEVIPHLDELDPLAKRIGAVNTVVNNNGRLVGYNTDALGAFRALEEKIALPGKSCLIFGAGGAARAIGYMLKEKDVAVSITNRSRERGEALALSIGCPFIPLDKVEEKDAGLLIQTTPVGMYPHIEQHPVPEHLLGVGKVVMDIIYNPLETRLLKIAKARGCKTISGLSMFVYQGAEQFRLWTGINPPVSAMSRAVKKALSEKNEGSQTQAPR
jgi:shikimate dehydrogenase